MKSLFDSEDILQKIYESGFTEDCLGCDGWGWTKSEEEELEICNFTPCEMCNQTGWEEMCPEDFGEYEFAF